MTDFQQLMRLSQQLQTRMSELQQSLESAQLTASSGGGMVTVTVDGKGQVKRIQIDPTCVDPRDVEMLEDLVLAAVTEAQGKARSAYEQEMNIKMSGEGPMAAMFAKMGNITSTTTVSSVETTTLAADLFTVPAGYKLKEQK